jgi:hypothetical protein
MKEAFSHQPNKSYYQSHYQQQSQSPRYQHSNHQLFTNGNGYSNGNGNGYGKTSSGGNVSCSDANANKNSRTQRHRELDSIIHNPKSLVSLDGLLDGLTALVLDCEPMKKNKNIDIFLTRCK